MSFTDPSIYSSILTAANDRTNNIRYITTSDNSTNDDYVVLANNNSNSSFMFTIRDVDCIKGRRLIIKNINEDNLIINTQNTQKIDGIYSITLNKLDILHIICDGSNWISLYKCNNIPPGDMVFG